jgi:hypothetical protein
MHPIFLYLVAHNQHLIINIACTDLRQSIPRLDNDIEFNLLCIPYLTTLVSELSNGIDW